MHFSQSERFRFQNVWGSMHPRRPKNIFLPLGGLKLFIKILKHLQNKKDKLLTVKILDDRF